MKLHSTNINNLNKGHFKLLSKLENIIGESIPVVDEVQGGTFGVLIEANEITGLGLYSRDLDHIPDLIFNISSLKALSLDSNRIKELPDAIGKLKLLKSLGLGNVIAFGTNNELTSLPESIGNLESLELLDLKSVKLTDLPATIGNLKSLRRLFLQDNQLKELPTSIGKLESLVELHLGYCEFPDIHGNELKKLPESIGDLSSLEILHIEENKLETLPDSIGELKSLKYLNVANNKLNNLPASIGKLKSLKYLNVANNELNNLPDSIKDLHNLETIDLQVNKFMILPESLSQLNSLRELKVGINQLKIVPIWIDKLISLTKLSFPDNQISTIPESISKLENLQELNLGGNFVSSLPEFIGSLSNLQEIDLSYNDLSKLPYSFSELKKLQILDLKGNKFDTFPKSILNLDELEYLDLGNNRLITIPEEVGSLNSLTYINLNHNNINDFPVALLTVEFLGRFEYDYYDRTVFTTNQLTSEFIEKCKGIVFKSSGYEKEFFMRVVELCETRDDINENLQKIKISFKQKFKNLFRKNYRAITYAGFIAFIGIITFLITGLIFPVMPPVVIWILFIFALIINFFIGASIISTISGYFKRYIETGLKGIQLIESKKINYLGRWLRRHLFGIFDIFVIFYLMWSLRSVIKNLFATELLAVVDSVIEYCWAVFGYNLEVSFLENLDFFLGHFFLKIFGIGIVFWALYRNGIGYIGKTIFEEKKKKKNLNFFLHIGFSGALILAIMENSDMKHLIVISYSIGVIIATCLFIWENNKDYILVFYLYLTIIVSGLFFVWLISFLSLIGSVSVGILYIIIFFIARWRIEINKSVIKYNVDPRQAKALIDLQITLKRPIPRYDNLGEYGIKLKEGNVIELKLDNFGLKSLPKSIGNLFKLESLDLAHNELKTIPKTVSGLKSLEYLELTGNKLITLPESIGGLDSLKDINFFDNYLTNVPSSVLKLKNLEVLDLGNNPLSTRFKLLMPKLYKNNVWLAKIENMIVFLEDDIEFQLKNIFELIDKLDTHLNLNFQYKRRPICRIFLNFFKREINVIHRNYEHANLPIVFVLKNIILIMKLLGSDSEISIISSEILNRIKAIKECYLLLLKKKQITLYFRPPVKKRII